MFTCEISVVDPEEASSSSNQKEVREGGRKEPVVRHVFLWNVIPGGGPSAILDELGALPGNLPFVRSWTMGGQRDNLENGSGQWGYALVCDFDHYEDLDKYNEHPLHVAVGRKTSFLFDAYALCDFEFGQ
jgi:hypothetical protein